MISLVLTQVLSNDLPSEVETENKLKDIEIHYKESILETASEIE